MPLQRLDHFLVVADDLEATRAFYTDVLGLAVGPRPPFAFPGYWLYAGEQAVVHLADRRREGGALDHVAFAATDLADMLERLRAHGIDAKHRRVPDRDLQQLFLRDPNGVTIELTFGGEQTPHA